MFHRWQYGNAGLDPHLRPHGHSGGGNGTYAAATNQMVSFNVASGSGGGTDSGETDAALPWWALAALGGGPLGVASRRRKAAVQGSRE